MSKPAARTGDAHTCPMVTGTVPHVGGPLAGPGEPTVLVGGQPAAVVGDLGTCTGPPDNMTSGSASVLAGGKPLVRLGDSTAHGGVVVAGEPTVLVGTFGGVGPAPVLRRMARRYTPGPFELAVVRRALWRAASDGIGLMALCPECAALARAARNPGTALPSPKPDGKDDTHGT